MKYRRYLVALAIAGAAAVTSYALANVQLFDFLVGESERKTVDYRVRASRTAQRDSSRIVLILFDQESSAAWPYREPFPRAFLADLVRTAAANGAAVIGLDVFLQQRNDALDAAFGDRGDERLRDAIRDAGNVVLVAMTRQQGDQRVLLQPDPYFADAAAAIATADLPTPYETVRAATLLSATQAGVTPSLALALYALSQRQSVDSLVAAAVQHGRLQISGLPARYATLRPGESLDMSVRFAGPPSRPFREDGTFRAYAAGPIATLGAATGFAPVDALASWMRGSIVLLGSGFHESERFRSPFYDYESADGELAGWTYGVEVHANALYNLLERRHLVHASRSVVVALLLLTGFIAAAATFWRGAKLGVLAALIAAALAAWLALEVFSRTGVVLPIIAPALAALLAYTSAVAYVSIVEGREKRMIRGAFSKYVPPGVVDDLVADPTRLKLGGEKRIVSILFSDVVGFTSMSEALPPETLVAVLNEYLDEMADIVLGERGTLDKYIGDAIMALWGAPAPVPEHALHACRAALRMQRRLTELNQEWRTRGATWPPMQIRTGINTGTPVVGNIGGEKRFDYTALGDAVNLAARLEPACKSYGVSIMIAEATRAGAGSGILVRELDMLAVYGKAEPVRVYELLGLAGETLHGPLGECIGHYESGLAAYRRRDFELAVRYFAAALDAKPDDGPARVYRERSLDYTVNPPPADWDFVERRQVK